MAFVSYDAFEKKYPSGEMAENIRRLKEMDSYHCLLAGGIRQMEIVKTMAPNLPKDFFSWLEVCDGGMLFDTALLTTSKYDPALDLNFDDYSIFMAQEIRLDNSISENWFVFARAIHSDIYFYDLSKKDGHIYQWDIESQQLHQEWPSLAKWLAHRIDEAVELIKDGFLDPMDIKFE